MTDLTEYAQEEFMEWSFLGNDMSPAHSNVYVALHDGDPTNTGEANELSAGDYDRAIVAADTAQWSMGSSGDATTIENDNEINFGVADSNWGTVSHFSLWDSETDGNALWASDLDDSKTIEENDELRFQAGDLTAEIN